ncbi:hypothetical protein [Bradyrhizobium sp. Arg816]|uniref:hypothetical protein n=1 Tax=Bradyrhizobium sp. Arg816 TaxID=2998491 RepID=UPI00249EDE55|nr:hypothetical protein [Bradyrhizobium sp. Arg816]MDI3566830.1 hypothetical protein [Bradyrhizobium sp. Arg816]
MKMLVEYLDRAVQLERLASSERDTNFKNQLLSQASAYRGLAAKRAKDYGLPAPSRSEMAHFRLSRVNRS